jgi:hypothetical protein
MYTLYPTYVLREDGAHIPMDELNADYLAFIEWASHNEPAQPPGPTLEQRAAAMLQAVDAHLNDAARAKGYDSIINAALRAALPASPFHAEGLAFGNWMDQVYSTCYQTLAQVQSGLIEEPGLEELIALLPSLVLPE